MEVMILCVTIGILMCSSMFGLGIAIGREVGKHERIDKAKLCGSDNRNDLRDDCVHGGGSGVFDNKGEVPIRCGNRQDIREVGKKERPKYIEEIDDESLSAILRAICKAGVCPSNGERMYLMEAASRLNDKEVEE